MKRKIYETPRTTYYSVEVEGSFAGSAEVRNPNTSNGKIDAHEVNTSFDGNDLWETGSWNIEQ